jgi:hypothetical protein
MFLFFGLGTSSRVSFFSIWFNSSSIALTQYWSFLSSSKLFGLAMDKSARFLCYGERILLWVSTPVYLSPIIYSGGWFVCTHHLGVLGGIYCSSSSSFVYGCSSSVASSSTSCSFRSSSSSYSYEYFLPSFPFYEYFLSIVTLILSTILLSLGLRNLYTLFFLEYLTSMPLSTQESNFSSLTSSLLE